MKFCVPSVCLERGRMISPSHPHDACSTPRASHANEMALGLTNAESALHALTSGQIDAIIDPSGNTYLLRHAQEHLRRNEARLQALFDSVPDVITVLNEAGEVQYQSPAVTRVLGYEAGALVGHGIFDFVHPDDLLEFYRAFSEAIRNASRTTTAEFRHQACGGAWRSLEATLCSPQSSGAPSVTLTYRDATHRHQAQEESDSRAAASVQGSLDKDHFLAMLVHELRTPLTPALLGIHDLQKESRLADAQPLLAMIRRNIELQSRLLDELMDFISVGQHKVRLNIESIDAHEAVGFVMETCRSEIATARIKVLLRLEARDKLVRADSMKLQQVLWNLLRNAIKFSPPGSSISITSANASADGFVIEIADQGIGIAAEFLPFVFDAYQQGDRSIQPRHGGLGLGMFIARGLVEAQHGTLTVASEGPGRGAKFRLCLKAAQTNRDPSSPAINGTQGAARTFHPKPPGAENV
jgi:two-component system CheB/CheR fusion protein